jgi:hypothetical protein
MPTQRQTFREPVQFRPVEGTAAQPDLFAYFNGLTLRARRRRNASVVAEAISVRAALLTQRTSNIPSRTTTTEMVVRITGMSK